VAQDIFAPGKGYSYYWCDGGVYRKASFQVPDVLADDLTWVRDERVDLMHDATPMRSEEVPGVVERVYGRKPKGLMDPPAKPRER
jgi:hypothetical protein